MMSHFISLSQLDFVPERIHTQIFSEKTVSVVVDNVKCIIYFFVLAEHILFIFCLDDEEADSAGAGSAVVELIALYSYLKDILSKSAADDLVYACKVVVGSVLSVDGIDHIYM